MKIHYNLCCVNLVEPSLAHLSLQQLHQVPRPRWSRRLQCDRIVALRIARQESCKVLAKNPAKCSLEILRCAR